MFYVFQVIEKLTFWLRNNMEIYSPSKLLSFKNQENEEITKID